jgi:dTDP-4-amino-4,6-dideoxygalactose transaminase
VEVPFNSAAYTGKEITYIQDLLGGGHLSGDGKYSKKCHEWFKEKLNLESALLTTSASTALDMSAILTNISPGDEVIMPSYTFVSTANSFALRGARIKFVDIRPDTMNLNEELIEQAITKNTKAIIPVHYAGVSCEMDTILNLAKENNLYVIEDAAQGMMAKYKGRELGSMGNLACYSFHETKNYTAGGEGGLLIVNDKTMMDRAEIIREKGTNRSQFFRGMTDKYTWQDIGSSFLPSDLNAAYLFANLEFAEDINNVRLKVWNKYYSAFEDLEKREIVTRPLTPEACVHNGHLFYLKLKNENERKEFISYMKSKGIITPFHYVPLHSSPAGLRLGEFIGEDKYTTKDSSRLVRLPLFYNITQDQQDKVIDCVLTFFK